MGNMNGDPGYTLPRGRSSDYTDPAAETVRILGVNLLTAEGMLERWRMGVSERPEVSEGFRRVVCAATADGWVAVVDRVIVS